MSRVMLVLALVLAPLGARAESLDELLSTLSTRLLDETRALVEAHVAAVGPRGPAGPEGPRGPSGVIGARGTLGVVGPRGVPGPDGVAGPVGPAGLTGARGDFGPQGPLGPAGPPGPLTSSVIANVRLRHSHDDYAPIRAQFPSQGCYVWQLPWTFEGFGTSTKYVSLSENGVLYFQYGCGLGPDDVNTDLPTSRTNQAALFFFWDDMKSYGDGEYIMYRSGGAPGGRVFHIHYRARINGACSSDHITFDIALHQGMSLVTVSYDAQSRCARLRGSGATIGMQWAGGASAKVYSVSRDAQVIDDDADGQTISFHPLSP